MKCPSCNSDEAFKDEEGWIICCICGDKRIKTGEGLWKIKHMNYSLEEELNFKKIKGLKCYGNNSICNR